MKIFVSSIVLLVLLQNCYAQDTNIVKYLPLKVGNVWVYQCTAAGYQCGFCTRRIKVKVINTSVINGKTYYQSQVTTTHISGSCSYCGGGFLPFSDFIRIDSLSGNVLLYTVTGGCPHLPNELLKDSLKARLHDTVRYDCQTPAQYNSYICTDTNNVTAFGVSRPARGYELLGFESCWGRSYVKGIGLWTAGSMSMFCTTNSYLIGCVLNGIVYGDTSTLVGIKQYSNKVPDVFFLSQNYPNPFNPKSNIKFQVAKLGEVKLIVFDIIGREITTLVDEQLKPGMYEVEWDGTNFPSGIYFYKLISADYSETKKMVLIK